MKFCIWSELFFAFVELTWQVPQLKLVKLWFAWIYQKFHLSILYDLLGQTWFAKILN